MDWHRLLRRLGLASTDHSIDDRPSHVHGPLGKVYVTPLEGNRRSHKIVAHKGIRLLIEPTPQIPNLQ